ncbi:S8 family peptidase [Agrococcus jejuensis]|uniref:S8 family peptidase n=1 Tax=Agrococcus jejuensis TaxID=399736 RepID=UPI001C92C7DC|nr:S8 family peptidase [Agrococcus jejuensis]
MRRTPRPTPLARRTLVATAIAAAAFMALPTAMASAAPSGAEPLDTAPVSVDAPVDELIIGYDAPASAPDAEQLVAESSVDVAVTDVAPVATGSEVVALDAAVSGAELDALVAELEAVDGVAYVEPNAMMTIAQTNDPGYGQLWGLQDGPTGIDAPGAWTESRGAGAVVAVLDTGITSHPDLNPNVLPGYDFVSNASAARDGNGRDANPADQGDWSAANECQPNSAARNSSWHGTHVAGTIAAVGDNGQGVVGAAYEARIVPVRVLARCGGSTTDIADAIIWAAGGSVSGVPANANPADVINLSLGGAGSCSTTTQRAIDTAVARGATVVVAAGNSNANASGFNPANCRNVVTVAATDIGGNRAFYSNYGTTVDISAPGGESAVRGEGILSTLNTGTTTPGSPSYAEYQGTSMATPHVAGVVALLAATEPGLTPAQIEQRLRATAASIPACSGGCGAGLVDAAAALAAG